MIKRLIKPRDIIEFEKYLIKDEKSEITVEKYIRDITAFYQYMIHSEISKEKIIAYKKHLEDIGYKPRSINSMLSSVNSFLAFMGRQDCKVKTLKLQPQVYCSAEKELTKTEYMQLLKTAKTKPQLHLIMQTICSTGIRVSELKYFTVESVKQGEIYVNCKGKNRTILLPIKLKKLLLKYAEKAGIATGVIFRSKNGQPVSRGSIWSRMKLLCKKAGINPVKVFPHNLRKLFARTFYTIEKDIAKLADILGHSSINTTRIYIITTGAEHRKKIERLGLII